VGTISYSDIRERLCDPYKWVFEAILVLVGYQLRLGMAGFANSVPYGSACFLYEQDYLVPKVNGHQFALLIKIKGSKTETGLNNSATYRYHTANRHPGPRMISKPNLKVVGIRALPDYLERDTTRHKNSAVFKFDLKWIFLRFQYSPQILKDS